MIAANAEDDGEVVSVEFHFNNATHPATPSAGGWTATVLAPVTPSSYGNISSYVLPHAFVGTAVIGDMPIADGTRVTAWVDGGGQATGFRIEVTVRDNLGNTATDAISVKVGGSMIKIGDGIVSNGSYFVMTNQLEGESFAGKTVTFKIGDTETRQTSVWQSGNAEELNLTTAR